MHGTTKASALENCPSLRSALPVAEREAAQCVLSNQPEIFRFWITFEFWNWLRERDREHFFSIHDAGTENSPCVTSWGLTESYQLSRWPYFPTVKCPSQDTLNIFSSHVRGANVSPLEWLSFKKETHSFMERRANGSPVAACRSLTQDQALLSAVVQTWDKKGRPWNTRATCHLPLLRWQLIQIPEHKNPKSNTKCIFSKTNGLQITPSLAELPSQPFQPTPLYSKKHLTKLEQKAPGKKNIFWLL